MKPHVIWGRASATHLKRVLVDSDGGMPHLATHVEAVPGNCDVCRAFNKALNGPIAGTTTVSSLNEKVKVGLLFLDDPVVAHAMDIISKCTPLHPVQPKNPQEVWDVFCAGRRGTFGPPECIQMDGGGEWADEIWTDVCAGRRIKMQFEGVGARP